MGETDEAPSLPLSRPEVDFDPSTCGRGLVVVDRDFGSNFDFVNDVDFTDQSQLDYFMLVHNAFSWPRSTPAELLRFKLESVPELLERFGLEIGEPLTGGWRP